MCVLGGDWRFPDERPGAVKGKGKHSERDGASSTTSGGEGGISAPVKEVVRRCLRVEPAERPDVDELIDILKAVIVELPDDEDRASPSGP
jgi:serine/threonine kinase 16